MKSKLILVGILLTLISSIPCEAKTFYGNMKDNISTRKDLQNHYKFNHKVGAILRYAPSEYQVVGLAGVTILDFVGKEVIWDLILRQGHFDLQDGAANFKGLKDGMNGRDLLEENEYRQTLQTINILTENFIRDNTVQMEKQKEVIELLQQRLEILEKAKETKNNELQ